GFRHVLLSADHPVANSRRAVRRIVRAVRPAIAWAVDGSDETSALGVDDLPCGPLPDTAYRMRLAAPARLVLSRTERCTLDVEVMNDGSVAWPPGALSGIALGNHWLSTGGEVLVWSDGRSSLETTLPPGEKTIVRIGV